MVNRRKEKYETINTSHGFFINPIIMDIFINFIMKGGEKMYNGLDWEVQEYGHIIRTYDLDISVHRITTKVYIYKDKYYVETWINDVRYLFQPLD